MCDIGRIMQGLGMKEYPDCALHLLQDVPKLLRDNDFEITAIIFGRELLGIEPYREQPSAFGLAVDIGTTTIAGSLLNLATAETLAVASRTNPQAVRGDDVVTRIDFLRRGEDERRELQELVVGAVQEILNQVCAEAGVVRNQVYIICCGGNTTMHHLLLGLDASAIAETPFIATAKRGLWNRATHVGLDAGHGAKLYTLPNISAYVGGDIVAGLLAHEVHSADKNILMIDIGTNGEMALRANGKTYACATAAGPAFEGARISCGMRAATGAISSVTINDDDIHIATVDEVAPRGLCGTGLLDAVAVLLALGIVDETGRMLEPEESGELPAAILERIIEDDEGIAFILASAEEDFPRITLTQRDVRELQLAKGAIAAGAAVLLESVGLTSDDLDEVLLAGGFGNYLRPASALRVGLIPQVNLERIRFVGNTALAGARLCLLSHRMREESEVIARETDYLELSGRPEFQMQFAEAMSFPET